jgi:ABC-type antimicrobial peptide transport system permease subunit
VLPDPAIYVALPGDAARARRLVVQSDDDGTGTRREALTLALRREIAALAPAEGPIPVKPWLEEYEQMQAASEMMAYTFAALGAFGLTLCAVGLYGILSYSVRRRLREYAVRIALGARSHDVVSLVVHDVAVTALAGIGIGAFVALWLTHSLSDAVHGVPYADAIALVCAEAVLLLVAAVACLGPLRQATTADPVEILRAT